MIAFLAKFLSEKQKNITSFRKGFVPALGIVFSAFLIIMMQPDLGTGTVMVGTCIIMIFVAGARISHFVFLGLIGLSGFVGLVLSAPYRIKRITSYLNPWEDPLGSGFQIIQSLYAVGPGGLFGLGLGQSRQKFFYLPEPQTDFIFAILSEEARLYRRIADSFALQRSIMERHQNRARCARFIRQFCRRRRHFDDSDSGYDQYRSRDWLDSCYRHYASVFKLWRFITDLDAHGGRRAAECQQVF